MGNLFSGTVGEHMSLRWHDDILIYMGKLLLSVMVLKVWEELFGSFFSLCSFTHCNSSVVTLSCRCFSVHFRPSAHHEEHC